MNTYKPPLVLHFIWHPSDYDIADQILKVVSRYLARDINLPFSRSLNIPVFFYSSDTPSIAPHDNPKEHGKINILFIFTSIHTTGHDKWYDYIRTLPCSGSFRPIPIALTREGLGHGSDGCLKNLNCVRVYEWSKVYMTQHAILAIAHEIYRHGLVDIKDGDKGKSLSVKIFISHAKSGDVGHLHAESIKRFVENTNMSHFFDATDISPGFKFDDEIINHIKESTLLAFVSDGYSSRYWCQREILCAKDQERPMLVVDCLEDYEDRIFPAGSNVPCVHVSPLLPLSEFDILRILTATLLETIRFHHTLELLKLYQFMGWIDQKCVIVSRPPEIHQLLSLKKDQNIKNIICYPEPPIYSEEIEWHQKLNIETCTPLWSTTENLSLFGIRVGISVSDTLSNGFSENHLHPDHSKRFAQDLSRHLLARSATLIYGGDLRKDGFTEFILNEAVALKNRLRTNDIHVENHLAWPIYKDDKEMIDWRANYRDIMQTVEHEIPDDIASEVDKDKYLNPSTSQNKYYWSRCLTEMRLQSIESSDARICAGGKLFGYKGKMPGVFEEILIAIDKKKPIYLLGAFGGVVGEVCKQLRGEQYSLMLTEGWQATHNAGYVDMQEIAKLNGEYANYNEAESQLRRIKISDLSSNAGLDENEYVQLMCSPFVDECVFLLLKGLCSRLSKEK